MLEDIMTEGECSQLRSLINTAETIVLCCHVNADGDALGSMLGLADVLKGMGKEPLVVAPDQYPDYLKWLPNSEKIVRYDKRRDYVNMVLKIADLIFCLDFNILSRTDAMAKVIEDSPAKKILIDHHLDPSVDAILTISHPEMSSTCELLFRIVWQMGECRAVNRFAELILRARRNRSGIKSLTRSRRIGSSRNRVAARTLVAGKRNRRSRS